ncbi:hypothetical protein [Sedimentisphaera salicampi]|uniref:PEP-CTERM protein-sorting domain-containing protein n=1 Tax=Sedimentisphaera salicampi TaxID=1941349 RepID=A0A1W6LKD2_9BACT|nr:hypothetical protein [Sedimentisphaera salicampi]ARN56212.1 hypothetical protein STSP1_00588 [Sedimentisphaera salicampi]
MKKIVFFLLLFSVLAAGETLAATNHYWSGGSEQDNLINNPDNYWDDKGVPAPADTLFFDNKWNPLMEMDSTVDLEVAEAYLGKATVDGVFEMNVSGGSLHVSDKFVMCKDNRSGMEATLNMSGGTISTGSWFTLGGNTKAAVNMTGGLLDVGTKLAMGMYGDASGVLNLDGGTVMAGEIDIVGQSTTEPTKINISYGTLKLEGDKVSDVLSFVSAGKIVSTTSYDVTASYDSNLDQTLVTAPEPATLAFLSAGFFALRKKRRS